MGAYVAAVGYLLKLVNSIAQALQQHHDELNGANAQKVATNDAEKKAVLDAGAPVSADESDRLWGANKAKFQPHNGPDRGDTAGLP